MEGGGLGVQEGVAEDGQELLDRVHVHVADEIKRIASGVCCSSGTDAFNIPVGACENFAELEANFGAGTGPKLT